MLRELMCRDWRLTRRDLLINAGIFLAFQVYFASRASSSRFFVVGASIIAALISATVMTKEDKVKGGAWTCSLPVSRKELVKGRILGGWLLMAAFMVMASLVGLAVPGGTVKAGELFRPETLFLVLAIFTVVSVLLYPFLVRFGFMGILIFLISVQILGTLALLAAILRTRSPEAGTRGGIRAAVETLKGSFSSVRDTLPDWAFFGLLLALLALLNWGGFKLTVALFRRKEF